MPPALRSGFSGSVYTLAMALAAELPPPGTLVRVTQQLPQRDRSWSNTIEGVLTRYQQAKTGSWFAHARDDKLWLDRLELRLADGELVILNLDQYTVIEAVDR
ncbi:MAG: hypothetical protein ACYS0G_14420 [Planctomycetota bacterium]|jgi:hypothetical protein